MSRIRILSMLAIFALAAAVLSACGGGGDDSTGGGGDGDAQAILDEATFEGVKSGTIDMTLSGSVEGDESMDFDVALSGPFQSTGGAESLPEADFDVSLSGSGGGESIDFAGGLTLLSDRAFVEYEGTEYEVDPTTFGFVKSALEQAESESGTEGSSETACTEAATKLDIGSFVSNLSDDGEEDVEGTATTKVSGELNAGAFVDAIIQLAEDPACASQLEAASGALPLDELEEAKGELEDAIKKAQMEVFVGNDDNIIRKVTGDLEISPESSSESVKLSFDITLGGVNEEQTISAPASAEPLEGLIKELGVDPEALLEGGGAGGLGSLLEGVTGGEVGAPEIEGSGSEGSGSEGSSGSGDEPSADESLEYLECLQEAKNANDLSACSAILE